jgi:quercetin dioxygenase-like cupin family protein
MKGGVFILMALLTVSCAPLPRQESESVPSTDTVETIDTTEASEPQNDLKPGSNEMLRAPMSMAEGLEVIISDVVIPPNASVPLHYHPGEEFIYVLEGSTTHTEEGKPDQLLEAGDTYVMPPGVKHAPRAGKEGARAIVFRVHVEGQPERILVEEE